MSGPDEQKSEPRAWLSLAKSWDVKAGELELYLAWFEGFDDVAFASAQGANYFASALLPRLWQGDPCPYATPLYRQAWYRGFYSAACWCLIHCAVETWANTPPPIANMIQWYAESTSKDLKCVPGRNLFVEQENPQ